MLKETSAESVFTKYDKQGNLVMLAVNNTHRRCVEFYKCEGISLEEAKDLLSGIIEIRGEIITKNNEANKD